MVAILRRLVGSLALKAFKRRHWRRVSSLWAVQSDESLTFFARAWSRQACGELPRFLAQRSAVGHEALLTRHWRHLVCFGLMWMESQSSLACCHLV